MREASSHSALHPVQREASSRSVQRPAQREALPHPALPAEVRKALRPVPGADGRPAESEACREPRLPAVERRSDAAVSRRAHPEQPVARWVDAAVQARPMALVVSRRPTEREPRRGQVREVAAAQDAQMAAEAALSSARAQLWGPQQVAAEAVPSARQPVEAEPSVLRRAEEEAQPGEPPEEAVAEQPSVVLEEVVVLRAEAQAAVEARRAAARVVEAVRPSAEPAAQVQPSEARAVRLSVEPSVRSDRPARARLARRRMTTAFRHEPALAQTERLRVQSSSAEGVECSS